LTAFDPNLTIDQKLDLSGARLGAFSWSVPDSASATQKCESTPPVKPSRSGWPCEILASGLTFDDLTIKSQGTDGDLNSKFLQQARSSESAFMTHEQILRSRGDLTQANTTYSGMREKRRLELWNTSKESFRRRIAAIILIVLDKSQAIFLGYGRFPEPPLLWSVSFVILGVLPSRDTFRMEKSSNNVIDDAPYSRFWYSLELFLPVVDLDMAKNWRPKKTGLRTYARIHQLAGWILVPVSLAALTGAIK
jgi:hypothetical protein